MKRPIHKASLEGLLCIVQSGSTTWICEYGGLMCFTKAASRPQDTRVTPDQAEAEITRRFKALQRKIRRMEADQ